MGVKRCVITGATGLIGASLVKAMEPGWEIHAVSRHRLPGLEGGSIHWHYMDVTREIGGDALPARTDAVIYLAQSEFFREFPERALDIFDVNTLGLLRYLDYARKSGARSFVYASSGGVYGSGDMSMSEETAVLAEGNLGFYLGSKLCSEIIALNYSKFMNLALLRFFFVYGPGQRKTMLIPRLVDAVSSGAPVALQGEQGIKLNPTFVSDAAAAIVRALELEGSHKINVAGPEILTLRQICDTIGTALGSRPVYKVETASPRHIIGDIGKMTQLLVAPRIGFQEGLRLLLQR